MSELPGSEEYVDSGAWLLSDPVHTKEGSSRTEPEREGWLEADMLPEWAQHPTHCPCVRSGALVWPCLPPAQHLGSEGAGESAVQASENNREALSGGQGLLHSCHLPPLPPAPGTDWRHWGHDQLPIASENLGAFA